MSERDEPQAAAGPVPASGRAYTEAARRAMREVDRAAPGHDGMQGAWEQHTDSCDALTCRRCALIHRAALVWWGGA